jgi:hypothetical protein
MDATGRWTREDDIPRELYLRALEAGFAAVEEGSASQGGGDGGSDDGSDEAPRAPP